LSPLRGTAAAFSDGGKGKERPLRKLGNNSQTLEEFLADDGCDLPNDHPHVQLYRHVTPIWHGGESTDELDDRIGDGYSCGFAVGYESGLISAVLKAEWAVGWYQKIRGYYLANDHTEEELGGDWNDCAERTAWAIPVTNVYVAITMQGTRSG
jgi:hypothetical protein